MGALFSLESFDDVNSKNSGLHPEFQKGYEEGYAASKAAQEESDEAINIELHEKLSEINFTYHEARQAILSEMTELFGAIANSFLPTLALVGTAATIQEMLLDASTKSISAKAKISVHPDQKRDLERYLDLFGETGCALVPDPTVPAQSVWVATDAHETCIDFQQMIIAVETALTAYTQLNTKERHHG